MTRLTTKTSDLIPEDEIRRIEAAWKSDTDKKLDRLVKFADNFEERYEGLLDLLVTRERRRAALWSAVIEKTLAGLVWAGIVAMCVGLWHYIKDELKRGP
jgi:hypothetical protein